MTEDVSRSVTDVVDGRPGGVPSVFWSAQTAQSPPLRVVLDTNVLLSLYVFADSRFAPLLAKIEGGEWRIFSRPDCLAEFRRVLDYPQFHLDAARQYAAFARYAAAVKFAVPAAESAVTLKLPRCKDRDDQKFLEVARDSAADWLVTADKALLQLARRERLCGLFRILTPEMALMTL